MVMAELHLLKSEYTEARSIHTQLLQLSDLDPILYACTLVNIAEIDVIVGAAEEEVQQNLKEAKGIFSTTKHFHPIVDIILADLKLREGHNLSASTLFQQCLKSNWGIQNAVVSFALGRFANRNRWQGVEYTITWPVVYLVHAQRCKEKLAVYKSLLFLGDVFIVRGDDQTATSLFVVALEGFVYMDVHHSRAQCLMRLGDLATKSGNFSHAAELWKVARPLFERSSQAKEVAQIDGRLAVLEHDQKAPVQLATLHPPERIVTDFSEVETAGTRKGEEGAGQKSLEGIMVSAL
jgi:hypothetical protein